MKKLSRMMFAGSAFVFSSLLFSGAASAAQEPLQDESCFLAPAKLSSDEVQAFLAKPASLLEQEPAGGLPLANKTRSLAGSSFKAVNALIDLSKTANDNQKAAIAAGLSRVVQACGETNADYAARIQKIVAELGDATMITAFMAASSDVQVAAVNAPGVANTSVGGGATNEGGSQRSGDNSTTFGGNETKENDNSAFDIGDAGASATEFISGVTQ